MNSRNVGSAPPPFYWKVPVAEKDYMSENYRRIRQIANQAQKKRSEPLKAAFIPGVTKNEKYAHVQSRVGEFLKTKKDPDGLEDMRGPPRRSMTGGSTPVNGRLSKSSTDLRMKQGNQPNQFQYNNPGPGNQRNTSIPGRRRRVSEESFNPQHESVYNWHFKDDVVQTAKVVNKFPTGAQFDNSHSTTSLPAKYCHRVEYLPCDGICAEENFVVDESQQPNSARSSSSCRTSRGCNTEETRILEDPLKRFPSQTNQLDRLGDENEADGTSTDIKRSPQPPKSRSVLTLPSQQNHGGWKPQTENWSPNNQRENSYTNQFDKKLNSMKVSPRLNSGNGYIKSSISQSSLKGVKSAQSNNGLISGEHHHSLGTVPKYLKQRQQEWKIQEEEKREAELNANVPQGYVQLSDAERAEHLKTFKRSTTNYDMLIGELNRIPIRIDTIRVRDHKIQLEQQLTRLEEAMKTFSRPRVWVKLDE